MVFNMSTYSFYEIDLNVSVLKIIWSLFFFNKNIHSVCFDFPSKAQLIFLLSCGTYKRHLFICLYNLFWFTIRVLQASMKRGYTITYCYILTSEKVIKYTLSFYGMFLIFVIDLFNKIEKQRR